MEAKNTSIVEKNKNIIFIAVGTLLILMIPFLAMQFNWQAPDPGNSVSDGVNWTLGDFMVAGILLFSTGLAFELVFRRVKNTKHRIFIALGLLALFFYIWVELAVGIFFNFGS